MKKYREIEDAIDDERVWTVVRIALLHSKRAVDGGNDDWPLLPDISKV